MTPDELVRMARCRDLASSGKAREIRAQARLSLAELAQACGIDEGTLSRWERGQRRPRSAVALRYLDVLDALQSEAAKSTVTS
jgi:transcriptional regulator with XRE-family HTH domain